MKYLRDRLVKYGDKKFIAKEYSLRIPVETFKNLLECAEEKTLHGILSESIGEEYYEQAQMVKDEIEKRNENLTTTVEDR